MTAKTEKIYWNGVLVGTITSPSFDNFDYYGGWSPIEDEELYSKFLKQVDEEGGAFVEIGEPNSKLTGTVELAPDEQIEIKLRSQRSRNKTNG